MSPLTSILVPEGAILFRIVLERFCLLSARGEFIGEPSGTGGVVMELDGTLA